MVDTVVIIGGQGVSEVSHELSESRADNMLLSYGGLQFKTDTIVGTRRISIVFSSENRSRVNLVLFHDIAVVSRDYRLYFTQNNNNDGSSFNWKGGNIIAEPILIPSLFYLDRNDHVDVGISNMSPGDEFVSLHLGLVPSELAFI